VVVGFYETVGYLPEALVNYLLLLGWSLDDRTEEFTREQMIRHFSLDRVSKAAASFDAKKLQAFQERHAQEVPVERRVELTLPFLERAGLVGSPPSEADRARARQVVTAAGDRIKVWGDVLQYEDFFAPADEIDYDDKAFRKRLVKPEDAAPLLERFRERLASADFTAAALDRELHDFTEAESVPIGSVIHALRVAVTGRAVGFGMFETLEILGRDVCLARIDRALARVGEVSARGPESGS
ncbi:MAG TPA: glutamate--tRNA ligase family protein, partial [bacterium]|nr:glutamate--tRNA ligase family protein [bacterium]